MELNLENDRAYDRAYSANKRAEKLGLTGRLNTSDIRKVIKDSNGICPLCDKPITIDDNSIDHIVNMPEGENEPGNLWLTHRSCNSVKRKLPWYEARFLILNKDTVKRCAQCENIFALSDMSAMGYCRPCSRKEYARTNKQRRKKQAKKREGNTLGLLGLFSG